MCSLSEGVYERGVERGMERGILKDIAQIALKMIQINRPIEEIMDYTDLAAEDIRKLAKEHQLQYNF